MRTNPENEVNNSPTSNVLNGRMTKPMVFVLFLIALLIFVLTEHYQSECDAVESAVESNINVINITVNTSEEFEKRDAENAPKVIIRQPTCPKSYLLIILEQICAELVTKKELCTPEDFYNKSKHKVPEQRYTGKQGQKEPKVPSIINYAVGGLLLSSLGAALVELYKAKRPSPNTKGKRTLSRKSSLADLTVLKHHRKELIRKESILEVAEESNHTKQLDSGALHPLQRRCSFPVGPNVSNFRNFETVPEKRMSINLGRPISEFDDGTSFVDSRKPSLITIDSRRTSIDRSISVDGRRISVDDSPEKRRHRLVHRH